MFVQILSIALLSGLGENMNVAYIDSAFIDTRMLAQTSTLSAVERCEVEKRIIAKERDMWKLETIQQAENALAFERRAGKAEASLSLEQRAHARTKAQRDALLAAPPLVKPSSELELSLIPDWVVPVAIGVGIGLGAGIGIGLVLGN